MSEFEEFLKIVKNNDSFLQEEPYKSCVSYASEIRKNNALNFLKPVKRFEYLKDMLADDNKDKRIYDPYFIASVLQGIYDVHMSACPDTCLEFLANPFIIAQMTKDGLIERTEDGYAASKKLRETAREIEEEAPDFSELMEEFAEIPEVPEDDITGIADFIHNMEMFGYEGPADVPELKPYFDALKVAYKKSVSD